MKPVAVFAILLIAVVGVFSQEKEITAEKYRMEYLDSWKRSRLFDRRITEKSEIFEEGRLKESESWLVEYVLPDRRRVVSERTSSGKTQRTELIEIGDARYCKRDDEKWTTRFGECIGGSGSGGPTPAVDRYTMKEEQVDGEMIRRFQNLVAFGVGSKDDVQVRFSESTFWVDAKGRLFKEETREGIYEPYSILSHRLEECEFEPRDLKIEAPILP